MGKTVVQLFAVLRYYDDEPYECIAECYSYIQAIKAIEYYGMSDLAGAYYRIELRYKVVEK